MSLCSNNSHTVSREWRELLIDPFPSGPLMKKLLVALLVASAAGSVMAQQQAPYATIKSVEGLVTVTSNNQLTNATANMALPQGADVLSTSSGKATVEFASGCTVTVQGGQSLQIQETACTAFLAANPGAAGATGMATSTKVLLGAAGLGLLYDRTRGGGAAGTGAIVELPATPGAPTVTTPTPVSRPLSGS